MRFAFLAVAGLLALVSFGATKTDHRRIVYVRNTSSLSDKQIRKALSAFQNAVSKDFAPIWGQDARLVYIGRAHAPKAAWVITLQSYVACLCYGFHDFQGKPEAFVDITASGKDWDLTFTHELFEMLADPFVDRGSISERGSYLVEVGDPVEDVSFAYTRSGVTISDFATPAWYQPNGKAPYDFKDHVTQPFQILKNGYACEWLFNEWVCAYG